MIPTDVDQADRMAQAISRSGMTPKAYGNDADKIFFGIIAGAEVGLAPFQALQSIAVIGNNPAIWGDGALALVQGSGVTVSAPVSSPLSAGWASTSSACCWSMARVSGWA